MDLIVKEFNELTTVEVYEILRARSTVFILEQKMNCQDMDRTDYSSLHFFYQEDSEVMAYLRAYYKDDSKDTVQIGRVLTLKHGNGLGRRLLEESIPVIKKKFHCKKICLDSQIHAVGFYEKLGFKVTSDEFLEEGVIHVTMELNVS